MTCCRPQVDPESAGVDVCASLRSFHSQHYHPRKCFLALLSPHPLEAMQREAVAAFGGWGEGENEEEDEEERVVHGPSTFGAVFGSSSTPAASSPVLVYRMVPVRRNYHWLTLAWVLPPTIGMYR